SVAGSVNLPGARPGHPPNLASRSVAGSVNLPGARPGHPVYKDVGNDKDGILSHPQIMKDKILPAVTLCLAAASGDGPAHSQTKPSARKLNVLMM
ncbi:MAG: hypothetical protein ACREEM_41240, partial [Blastocatellia bacterium]